LRVGIVAAVLKDEQTNRSSLFLKLDDRSTSAVIDETTIFGEDERSIPT